MAKPGAVCIVSGGLDSICYAASLAANDGYDLYLLTFVYGQRAKREIERARYFAKVLKAKDNNVVDISCMKRLYGKTNTLTDNKQKLSHDLSQNIVMPVRRYIIKTKSMV